MRSRSSDKRVATCSQTDESGRTGLAFRYRTHGELDENVLAGDLIKKLKAPASASELDPGQPASRSGRQGPSGTGPGAGYR
jgi:hypothetical protein